MSQVKTLPITATRWLSLLLCAITAATITIFLSKVDFILQAYASWGAILSAHPILYYSGAFLAGIGIKLLLDKFYISHPKRGIEFSWRYPPVTIAVLASLFIIAFYMLSTAPKLDEAALYAQSFMSLKYLALTFIGMLITVIYQTKLYTQKPVFTAVLVTLSAIYISFSVSVADIEPAFTVFICLAASYFVLGTYLLLDEYRQSKQQTSTSENESIETTENLELKTLKDFREWFKDDSIIKNTEQLEPDLQVYAKRITERLQNGGDKYEKDLAQHIAICGPYGCGKSSIVESIVNDLAKKSEKESAWIHSDISTWGAASGSVAHVVLSNIIDDISQHIDMCAFRALPKHYTEALKLGGSWLQFASTLLVSPVDTDTLFQKLSDVLETTNYKLLITLQDIDRGTGDENEKRLNNIAALLDKLKGKSLSHINFIVAMGNENEVAAEVISKATDYREDIAKINFRTILASFIEVSVTEAERNKKIILYKYGATHETDKQDRVNEIINSARQFKKVLRRVNQAWQPDKLMGEVNFYSLLMVTALRETNPIYFERYCKADAYLESEIKDKKDDLENVLRKIAQLWKRDITEQQYKSNPDIIRSELIYNYLKVMLLKSNVTHLTDITSERLKLDLSKDHEQSVGCTNSNIDYLKRMLLERVPHHELSDQSIINIVEEGQRDLIKFIGKYLALKNSNYEAQYSLFAVMRSKDENTSIYVYEKDIPTSIGKLDDQGTCRVIQFIAYYLTLENMYEVFNQLFNAKDDREKLQALVCYLGVESFTEDLDTLEDNPVGMLILNILQISLNKLPANTSSISSEQDELADFFKLKTRDSPVVEDIKLLNADFLQAQYVEISKS